MAEEENFPKATVEDEKHYIIESTRSIMGTSVTITLIHTNVKEAKEALSHSFNEIQRIEDLMSIYKKDSQISILNREGSLKNANTETIFVIKKAIHYSKLSEAAFNPLVLPIIDLWEEKLKKGGTPTETEIKKTLDMVDYRNIVINKRNIKFNKKGMRITLGAIAKGYAIDKAIETLKSKGIKHALINAGGDIRVMGGKTENTPWKVAVRDPSNKKDFVTVVELCDGAIATSGSYERFIGNEIRVSHIINAKTGQPAQELASATIIAEKAIDADALSTIIFILGAEKGLKLVESLKNVEALIIKKDGTVLKSSGFQIYEAKEEVTENGKIP